MKNIFTIALIILATSCQNKQEYATSNCLSEKDEKEFLYEMVRYANKLAPEANTQTMFETTFNWYYDKAIQESSIWWCYRNEQNNTFQLFVARDARSVVPMKEGIAVEFAFNEQGTLEKYNEIFRTWKMPEDTLRLRGDFLFRTWIKGGDLNLYTAAFQKDKFIEFPDNRFTFDTLHRRWRDTLLDSISAQ